MLDAQPSPPDERVHDLLDVGLVAQTSQGEHLTHDLLDAYDGILLHNDVLDGVDTFQVGLDDLGGLLGAL